VCIARSNGKAKTLSKVYFVFEKQGITIRRSRIGEKDMALEVGMKWQETEEVTKDNTAAVLGSGGMNVYATPAMILLMEKASWTLAGKELEEGLTTVGTSVNVKHLSASPIGSTITCNTELVEIDRKRLVFHVEAFDNVGKIGEGTHERFIVESEKFLAKTEAKLK